MVDAVPAMTLEVQVEGQWRGHQQRAQASTRSFRQRWRNACGRPGLILYCPFKLLRLPAWGAGRTR